MELPAKRCHTQSHMGLLLKIASLLLRAASRVTALLIVLFVAHLTIRIAFPFVEETFRILDNRPLLSARVESLKTQAEHELAHERQLRERIVQMATEQRARLSSHLEVLEKEIHQLTNRKVELEARIDSIRQEQAAYCSSYNPFKRWACFELRERNEAILAELDEAMSSLLRRGEELSGAVDDGKRTLSRMSEEWENKADHLLFQNQDAKEANAHLRELLSRRVQLEEQLARATEAQKKAETLAASLPGRLLTEWRRVAPSLLLIVAAVVAAPYLQRTLAYFVLMPLVSRAAPLRLLEGEQKSHPEIKSADSARTLQIRLRPGSELHVRAAYARSLESADDCFVSSRLLYSWSAPAVSYSAGLSMLTRVVVSPGASRDRNVSISAPRDPDSYLMCVELDGHPGLVVHPRHLVGIGGGLEVSTRWRLGHLHAWSRGQLRYILLQGSGTVILEGRGDIVSEELHGSRARIEQEHLMGFDARLEASTRRTETFLPYLLGKTPLVDAQFEGEGPYFWQKSVSDSSRPLAERTLDLFFGALGKFLGF